MKYRNVKTVVDNIKFDSKKEALRYLELKQWQKEGKIKCLELQPTYSIFVEMTRICTYKADFSYVVNNRVVTEDVKGIKTPVYRLKKKLMKVCHGIDILET